jgi:hypothetical protein
MARQRWPLPAGAWPAACASLLSLAGGTPRGRDRPRRRLPRAGELTEPRRGVGNPAHSSPLHAGPAAALTRSSLPPASPAGREAGGTPERCRYGLDTTGAFTSMDVCVTVSFPFLARALIMSSLVSTVGATPGFHLTMTVRHNGE